MTIPPTQKPNQKMPERISNVELTLASIQTELDKYKKDIESDVKLINLNLENSINNIITKIDTIEKFLTTSIVSVKDISTSITRELTDLSVRVISGTISDKPLIEKVNIIEINLAMVIKELHIIKEDTDAITADLHKNIEDFKNHINGHSLAMDVAIREVDRRIVETTNKLSAEFNEKIANLSDKTREIEIAQIAKHSELNVKDSNDKRENEKSTKLKIALLSGALALLAAIVGFIGNLIVKFI